MINIKIWLANKTNIRLGARGVTFGRGELAWWLESQTLCFLDQATTEFLNIYNKKVWTFACNYRYIGKIPCRNCQVEPSKIYVFIDPEQGCGAVTF